MLQNSYTVSSIMARQKTPSNIECQHRHAEGVRLRTAAATQLICEKYKMKPEYDEIEKIIIAAFTISLSKADTEEI